MSTVYCPRDGEDEPVGKDRLIDSQPAMPLFLHLSSPPPPSHEITTHLSSPSFPLHCFLPSYFSPSSPHALSATPSFRRFKLPFMPPRRNGSFNLSYCHSFIANRASEFESGDEEDKICTEDEEEEESEALVTSSLLPERWDVLGLGQAMVDFSGMVDDEFLQKLELEKGTRKVVNHEERGRVLRAMDGCTYKAAAGGSLSNTLVALARLGIGPVGGPALNVAMAGSVGSDPLGSFYRAKLGRANVHFLSAAIKDGTTGTVIVLTTPDAQRTMLAYQGTSSSVDYDTYLASIIPKTKLLIVEGYLFELPDTIRTIRKACKQAHESGSMVAVTASDVSCIERHYDDFWDIVGSHADIVFANSDEARALCDFDSKESPTSAARYLSHFVPMVSVTDGPRGSYVGLKGEAIYIPPAHCVPVDTCGAGDVYASGLLYGILHGSSDLKAMGGLAAKVAATVVGQQGTRLRIQDAVKLANTVPFHPHGSSFRSDIETDHISSL